MFTRARHLSRSKCIRLFSTAVHEESDIVIVGAGPAGLALAGALGNQSVHSTVHCISSQSNSIKAAYQKFSQDYPYRSHGSFEDQALALSCFWILQQSELPYQRIPGFSKRYRSIITYPIGLRPLLDIGAWDHVEHGRTCPIDEMQVGLFVFNKVIKVRALA